MTDSREQGVEFGEFEERLRDQTYPTTAATLVDAYGDLVVSLEGGEETVGEILGSVEEEYGSPGEVRQAVYNLVGIEAVGRKRYTDRDPPTLGDRSGELAESF